MMRQEKRVFTHLACPARRALTSLKVWCWEVLQSKRHADDLEVDSETQTKILQSGAVIDPSPGAPAKPFTGMMLPSTPFGSLDVAVILPGGPASPASITGGGGRVASIGSSGAGRLWLGLWGPPALAAVTSTSGEDWKEKWRRQKRGKGQCEEEIRHGTIKVNFIRIVGIDGKLLGGL